MKNVIVAIVFLGNSGILDKLAYGAVEAKGRQGFTDAEGLTSFVGLFQFSANANWSRNRFEKNLKKLQEPIFSTFFLRLPTSLGFLPLNNRGLLESLIQNPLQSYLSRVGTPQQPVGASHLKRKNYMKYVTTKLPASEIAFLGLDVHQATITVAMCGEKGKPVHIATIPNKDRDITNFFTQLNKRYQEIHTTYEAGGCGFHLHRVLTDLEIPNVVLAPSKLAKAPGNKVKNDKFDAIMLSDALRKYRVLNNNEISPVFIPHLEDEAMRDLTRYRDGVKKQVKVVKNQILGLLRRHGHSYQAGKTKWTKVFYRWLNARKLDHPDLQMILVELIEELERLDAKVAQIDQTLTAKRKAWRKNPVVQALMSLRGIAEYTAISVAAEIGCFTRFESAAKFMSYLGLTPSEYSSGERVTKNKVAVGKVKRGSITKAGNRRVRSLLVEAAIHAAKVPRKKGAFLQRSKGLPKVITDHAWKGQKRLYQTYWRLTNRGKPTNVARTAVARELAGFIWAIANLAEVAVEGGVTDFQQVA